MKKSLEMPFDGGPCQGIRVVEFATMVSGPLAGQLLADYGAEVVKVEPLSGDPLRSGRPNHNGLAAGFALFNRNKKSVGLDLKSEDGRRSARALALSADVVIENFRPGVMERLDLGYEALVSDNPGLIYLSITGFGESGPFASRPAYDHVIQALSGTMPGIGTRDKPEPVRNSIVDKVTAMTAANGVLAALVNRERNGGKGQKVSVSLLDAYAAFMLPDLMAGHIFQDESVDRTPPAGTYFPLETSDGHVLGHVLTDAQFQGLCRMFRREDLLGDSRFADMRRRRSQCGAMWGEFAAAARTMTTAEIESLAGQFDVPLAGVNDVDGFFSNSQVLHNGTYFDSEDATVGRLRQLACPVKFHATPARYTRRAPLLGEDAEEVLGHLRSPQAAR